MRAEAWYAEHARVFCRHVGLVVRDAMPLEKGDEFVLERQFGMVGLVVQNIRLGRLKYRWAHHEGRAAGLARERVNRRHVLVHPFR